MLDEGRVREIVREEIASRQEFSRNRPAVRIPKAASSLSLRSAYERASRERLEQALKTKEASA